MEHFLWLIPLGFLLGTLGTLIGAGGGFILVPLLLLLYPHETPETITSISLAVVFFNALSGSWAYARMHRIDYRSGLLFASAGIPGAVAGVLTTDIIPRRAFNGVFGVLMVIAAFYLILHRNQRGEQKEPRGKRRTVSTIIETDGTHHTFSYDPRLGMGLSVCIGFFSSLLGIGGGIIHVPVLVHLLGFPVHIATATSHFILAIMALTGTLVHIATGSFSQASVYRTVFLGIGVLFGAQAGASVSRRVQGVWIIRCLAVAIALVGFRILMMALRP